MRGLVLLALAAAACSRSPDVHGATQPPGVLAASGSDTVWLGTDSQGARRLTWTTWANGGRRLRWESRALYGAAPIARLVRINRDELPDLFWTVDFEELVGGMVLFASGDTARMAAATAADEVCRPPELRHVTGDSLLDFVTFRPSALSADECRADAAAAPCVAAYPTEWAVAHVQEVDGFVDDPSKARAFYLAAARVYRAAADSLSLAIRQRSGPAAASPRCNSELAAQLRDMGYRARRLGQGN